MYTFQSFKAFSGDFLCMYSSMKCVLFWHLQTSVFVYINCNQQVTLLMTNAFH